MLQPRMYIYNMYKGKMAKFISTSWYAELHNLCNTGPIEYSMTSDLRHSII